MYFQTTEILNVMPVVISHWYSSENAMQKVKVIQKSCPRLVSKKGTSGLQNPTVTFPWQDHFIVKVDSKFLLKIPF